MCCRHLGTPAYYGHQSNGFQQAANRYYKNTNGKQTNDKQTKTASSKDDLFNNKKKDKNVKKIFFKGFCFKMLH